MRQIAAASSYVQWANRPTNMTPAVHRFLCPSATAVEAMAFVASQALSRPVEVVLRMSLCRGVCVCHRGRNGAANP